MIKRIYDLIIKKLVTKQQCRSILIANCYVNQASGCKSVALCKLRCRQSNIVRLNFFLLHYAMSHNNNGGQLAIIRVIEDITCPRVDMNFIFEWSTQYLTSERSERVRYRVDHEKIKFISISGHVIFCLLYKHQ